MAETAQSMESDFCKGSQTIWPQPLARDFQSQIKKTSGSFTRFIPKTRLGKQCLANSAICLPSAQEENFIWAGQPYLTLTYMVDKSVNYQYTTEVKQILPLSIAPRLLKKKEKSVIISNRCVWPFWMERNDSSPQAGCITWLFRKPCSFVLMFLFVVLQMWGGVPTRGSSFVVLKRSGHFGRQSGGCTLSEREVWTASRKELLRAFLDSAAEVWRW